MFFVAVAVAVLMCVTATVVLTRGYARAESTAMIPPLVLSNIGENSSDASATDSTASQLAETSVSDPSMTEGGASAADASARLLREREREARERERRRAEEQRPDSSWPEKTTAPASSAAPSTAQDATASATKKTDGPKPGPKTATVQVTYDEAGRVTQASGSDPTALRIARQKRFPSGKPGTTTITIPIN
jgi:hypothetical protein